MIVKSFEGIRDDEIVVEYRNNSDGDGLGASPSHCRASVELVFPPGNPAPALKALCKALIDVLVAARKAEGTHG